MSYLDKVTVGSTTYDIQDSKAQADVADLKSAIGDVGYVNTPISIGDAANGGWQGSVGSTITYTTAASYRRYSVSASKGNKYKLTVSRRTSNNYPFYGYFCDSSDKVLSAFGSPASADYTETTYTETAPEGTETLKFMTDYLFTPTLYREDVVDLQTQITTVATIANSKEDFSALRVYVSGDGNDSNNGDFNTPFRTIQAAINSGAEEILVKSGTYDERISGTGKKLTIKPFDGNTIILNPTVIGNVGVEFSDSDLKFYGITVYGSEDYSSAEPTYVLQRQGFMLTHCTVYMENCKAIGCRTAGIRCDGSVSELHNCEARYNGTATNTDGFNAHNWEDTDNNITYYPSMYLYDCIADHNGDDGVSVHEGGYLYVSGGEFTYNGTGGITPNGGCRCAIYGAKCLNNKFGIDAYQNIEQSNPQTTVLAVGNIIENNITYGIQAVKYNVLSVGNVFAGNGENTYSDNGTITEY